MMRIFGLMATMICGMVTSEWEEEENVEEDGNNDGDDLAWIRLKMA